MMTPRDEEIALAVARRTGLDKPGLTGWRPRYLNLQTRRLGLAEVHWVCESGDFTHGGCYWPEPSAALSGFVDNIRRHSFEVFYHETCPEFGIPTDPDSVVTEKHVIWPFALDLAQWALCPLDEPLYRAKRKHSAFLERWFAAFPAPRPTARMIEVLSRNLCQYAGLPYPGPFSLRSTPLYPQPEPPPVPYEIRRVLPKLSAPVGAPPRRPRAIQDEAFLASVREARAAKPGSTRVRGVTIWWLGRSGFLLHWNGRCILLDPCLSNAGVGDGPKRVGVVPADRLDFIDLVVVAHHETDHLDPTTLRTLARVNPKLILVCPATMRALARERSRLPEGRIVSIDPQPERAPGYAMFGAGRGRVCGFHIIPVVAKRGPDVPADRGAGPVPMGVIIEQGDLAIYHGSHARLSGQAVIELGSWRVSVALLPIGGRVAPHDPAGNYWGDEAALLAKDIEAELVVPCHYDPFESGVVTTEEFVEACTRLQQAFRILCPGERLRIDACNPGPAFR